MKHKVYSILIALLLILPSISQAKNAESIVFYYNDIDSVRELMNFERVVVTPSLITNKQIETLHKAGTQVFAYLSVGEFDGEILPRQLQGKSPLINVNWQSHVMDLSAPEWQAYLNNEATSLMSKGFDGLFLDTLDSYTLFAKNETTKRQQQKSLAHILTEFHQLKSKPKLIFNRGFEVVHQLGFKPEALVAESLYHRYDPLSNSYHDVIATDTEWLTGKLNDVKQKGIEAIVIDYLPGSNRDAQQRAAQRLLDEGYTPYISDGMLYEIGVSTVIPVTKRVLGFYDSQFGGMTTSQCHRMMSMPFEYKGYVPECHDVRQTQFDRIDLTRYAAIFLWLESSSYQQTPALTQWLDSTIGHKQILFINALPTDQALLSKLGIAQRGTLSGKISITKGNEWLKGYYPASFSELETHSQWQSTDIAVSSLIEAKDVDGKQTTLMFNAPWGGAILSPYPVMSLANSSETWLLDPFRLIKRLIDLPDIPAADATTESGLRIVTSHVDGDGFPSKAWFPGKPYTAEVLLKHVFKPYPLPQTVSVIEGEVGKRGLYPKESAAMEAVAREIFALPNIELASHTFSHPFFWDLSKNIKEKQYGDHLPIPGYTVDYHNEIIGSVDYINKNLAPKGKDVKLILWSGKADPKEDILAIAEQANILNVNGGNTYVVRGDNNFTQVSPTITWYPTAVHVYAPVLNENLYTNLWTEHHDGYSRAVETFEILGSPRRLKTISIYYHMYSGAYPASLKGLLDVYDWAMKQDATPLYLSEYAERARTLYETGIAKTLDGRWQVTTSGIRSIRLPNQLGYPDSTQIAGWNAGPDGKYLILNQPRTTFTTRDTQPAGIRLKSANGQLLNWRNNNGKIAWSVKSHMPLKLEISGASTCSVVSGDALYQSKVDRQTLRLTSKKAGVLSGALRCQL
ncbi:RNA-binding protein [Photobacterium sanctipauli]|uniref:RNA-binding protein n=1 Tax=Photobacterium sanctipauli TaxID=1342794 RepID=A0A2T3NVK8_9GAMM|nr:endo alpha-1,4 polygalactosaminidase [Photobacterium sanctipauli]PSW20258.1 RNA-binding protein [Photobacterium sanctipauli]